MIIHHLPAHPPACPHALLPLPPTPRPPTHQPTQPNPATPNPRTFPPTPAPPQVPLRCQVDAISFSAHADFAQTSEFTDLLQPPHIVLVHGEATGGWVGGGVL